jgi:signal transduction histidine kinase
MRRRLLLTMLGLTVAAVLVVAVPTALVASSGPAVLVLALGAAVLVAALVAALILSRRLARPLEELAEAADRLRSGDPRPIGRRYGVAELDQVADGLDSSGRRVTSLLTAERELAVDASHQLRTPLTALSMRLEEVIAAADDPAAVREEGGAALAQAERLADVVSQLLDPSRRATAGTASLTGIDEIIDQQVVEWEPAWAAGARHPGRPGSGPGHPGGQLADARGRDGRDPHLAEHQVGRDRGRGPG